MSYKRWTTEDDNYILENYKTMSICELATHLDRSERMIKLRGNKLGINFQNRWSDYELAFVRENYPSMDLQEMSAVLNRTVGAIHQAAYSLGIKRDDKWTEDEISYLIEHHKTKTYREICEALGRSECAVSIKINKLGLKKDKYSYNHDYFENIDTPEKAYWLGFIYADGNVREDTVRHGYAVSIGLQKSDYKHLKKFNKALNGNVEVKFNSSTCNLNGKICEACRIEFHSKKMVQDLKRHGAVPNKTFVIEYPDIPNEFDRDFIRGYFDGDGCLYKSDHKGKTSTLHANFTCGSVKFLEQLRSILYTYDIKTYFDIQPNHAPRLCVGGIVNTYNFLNFMYDDACVYLDRKYEKRDYLYTYLNIEQRLLRLSETRGINLNEKESGNPETEIRVEGCV